MDRVYGPKSVVAAYVGLISRREPAPLGLPHDFLPEFSVFYGHHFISKGRSAFQTFLV